MHSRLLHKVSTLESNRGPEDDVQLIGACRIRAFATIPSRLWMGTSMLTTLWSSATLLLPFMRPLLLARSSRLVASMSKPPAVPGRQVAGVRLGRPPAGQDENR